MYNSSSADGRQLVTLIPVMDLRICGRPNIKVAARTQNKS